MDFFDKPNQWKEHSIAVGRPWRKDELRLKSNVDLHKLWYVLLKERNMLMTMQEAHNREADEMPNPERFEKVEESMEHILEVVEERNTALAELEEGRVDGPEEVWDFDVFGRTSEKLTSEHSTPRYLDKDYVDRRDMRMIGDWNIKYMKLERERSIRKQNYDRFVKNKKEATERLESERIRPPDE